jgi:hypothetical protein
MTSTGKAMDTHCTSIAQALGKPRNVTKLIKARSAGNASITRPRKAQAGAQQTTVLEHPGGHDTGASNTAEDDSYVSSDALSWLGALRAANTSC